MVTFHQSLDGFDFHPELPFVVHGTARIDVVVTLGRLKRRRNPFVQRVRRLHVVVRITQRCRFTRRFNPVSVDQRMTLSRNDLDMLQADSSHLGSHKVRGLLHIGLVLSQGTDTGDAKQILQLGQKPLLITTGIIHSRGSHKLYSLSRKRTRSIYPSLKRLSIPGLRGQVRKRFTSSTPSIPSRERVLFWVGQPLQRSVERRLLSLE